MSGPQQPFQPFRTNPDADPKANAMAFIEWVAEALWRIHALSDANLRYSRSMYEAMFRASQPRAQAPPQGPPGRAVGGVGGLGPRRGRKVSEVAMDSAQFLVQNKEQIARFLKMFLK